jgi:hypothetical protein
MSEINDSHLPVLTPTMATIRRRVSAAVRTSRKSIAHLSDSTGIPLTTLRGRLQRPDRLSVGELNRICRAVDIDIVTLFRYDPWAHAEALGIDVIVRPLRAAHGLWLPEHRSIIICDRVQPWGIEAIVAHELAHAVLGHTGSTPKAEFDANRLAMRWIATSSEALEALDPDGAISSHKAHEAGFTSRMLRDYITPLAVEPALLCGQAS